jgi:HD-GYP domain-containing protein (c-di-GMP phosphodiesterase class II)
MQTKIPSDKLVAGMFVADLDRSWIGTPFLFQGFLIENDEHLMQLRQYCKYVLVDSEFSTSKAQDAISNFGNNSEKSSPGHAHIFEDSLSDDAGDLKLQASFIPDSIKLTPFHNIVPIDAELAPAGTTYARTAEVLSDLFKDLASNNLLDLQEVDSVVRDMVESMVRNPDALMLISRLLQEDKTVYGHGINVAIYLVALGRHLSLPKDMLERLGTLGLLLDIGKTRLPHELLHKEGRLTSEEFETIKDHVPICLDILKSIPDVHPDVLEGVAQHHERENGSGYPAGLSKGDIGLFGRMAAIADSFSAMTNPRPYAKVIPAYEALQVMANFGHDLYHPPIVEQFIRAIGIFPVGSMVELSTGEVAIVISHSKVRRLKPRVLIISDKDKTPSQSPTTLDLLHPPATNEEPPSILHGLPTGAFGLNPREYYAG